MGTEKRILFIRGFNTSINNNLTKYTYIQFDNVFLTSNINCKYFDYDSYEDLEDVYKRLCNEIESNIYDVYCAHSMGGGLLMRYCCEHPMMDECKQHKIILMMPLIYINPLFSRIINILPNWLSIPKALLLPNNFLFETGNMLNDNYYFTPIKQVKQMNEFIDDFQDNMIQSDILKKNNLHLIYANEEIFTLIPSYIISMIKNFHRVNGKHECFNENENSNIFFKVFLSIINDKP